jgi:hypothetical protein
MDGGGSLWLASQSPQLASVVAPRPKLNATIRIAQAIELRNWQQVAMR